MRREFPTSVKREAHKRAQGICECHRCPHVFAVFCGQPLGIGNTFYEHIVCDGIDGEPTLDNCAVLTKTCWKYKTDSYDKRVVAKTRRVGDIAKGIRRRSSFAGSRNDWRSKKMDGTVIDRRTGEPIGRGR